MGTNCKKSSKLLRNRVTVMLTDSQYAKLRELAKQNYDRPLSNFLRKYLRDTILKEVTEE